MTDTGRTHDPTLHELTAELDGLRELLLAKLESNREILDERDRLYKERDDARRTAVDAALAAVKEQTKASFDASEKAIVKAEEAQKAYNSSHNDLARKMDEQNKATMPRAETEARFSALEEKISALREQAGIIGGERRGGSALKEESRQNISLVVAVIGMLVAVGTALAVLFSRS